MYITFLFLVASFVATGFVTADPMVIPSVTLPGFRLHRQYFGLWRLLSFYKC